MEAYKTLTNEEYNLLNKIATKTKTDCWFVLEQDEHGVDYVHDLEKNENLSLVDGVSMLMEAIDCEENFQSCNLSIEEENVLKVLLSKLGI